MKNTFLKSFVFIGFTYFISIAYANSDSLKLVQLFDSIIKIADGTQRNDAILSAKRYANKNDVLKDQFNYLSAKLYFSTGKLDSALAICKVALNDTASEPNNLKHAKFYNILASIYAYQTDNANAIANFQKAIKILEQKQKFQLAGQINNNIANIFFSIFDYPQAYKYSKRSVELLIETKDTVYLPAVFAVNAVSAIKLDSLSLGRTLLKKSTELSQKYNNALGYLLSNYGYGELYAETNQFDSANMFYNASLKFSEKFNLKFYQLINHLGLASLNTRSGKPELSINSGLTAIKLLQELKNENANYSVLYSLSSAYAQVKKEDSAYFYLNQAHAMLKQIGSTENKKVLNELLVKYETSKKENELVLAQNKIVRNRFYIAILVGVSILLVLIFLITYFYLKRKAYLIKAEQEKQLFLSTLEAEERERERISNELHDGVLSHMTALRLKLNNADVAQQDLTTIQNDIRIIAHNLFPINFSKVSLSDAISKFCSENTSNTLKLDFYSSGHSNSQMDMITSKTLYLIVQELIQNVIKHAKANQCFINLMYKDKALTLSVEDNGLGIEQNVINAGQGIESIRKRISVLNGTFDISSEINKGTICQIKIV